MALGYTIASILKRSSHVFSDDRVSVKVDWLEQLNRKYIQVCIYICMALDQFILAILERNQILKFLPLIIMRVFCEGPRKRPVICEMHRGAIRLGWFICFPHIH